ncbi:GNAT family N-acetyltransferase [Vibrio sonorensis]|uniref:GNAT family N-acetyltransferase n=1 Tax=Vibrio sonorensis TaxID=1004316 RepID=UPI000AB5159A|nr:GNAT family N-acetyltransferase [Vibrio sonorensis]
MMNVSLQPIGEHQRHILENLFPFYIYDMSEYMGWGPNGDGCYPYDNCNFDVYWQRDDHFPFFIYCNEQLAGFVLVRKYPNDRERYDIAQFFILRKFKRQGIGTEVLHQVLNRFRGKWQVRVLLENHGALNFWQKAISNVQIATSKNVSDWMWIW